MTGLRARATKMIEDGFDEAVKERFKFGATTVLSKDDNAAFTDHFTNAMNDLLMARADALEVVSKVVPD